MANQHQFDSRTTEERFWAKVTKTDGCWLWTGAHQKAGYGRFKVNGKLEGAHRVAFELANGPIAKGMVLCHRCDNPPCVNPAHLFVGTYGDNARDAVQKGRKIVPSSTRFKSGAAPVNRSLTLEQATEVKLQIAGRGTTTLLQLAKKLGLPPHLIRDISSGRAYK